ncbi:hypothetical protein PHYNN_80 [Pantoea phage Phynn]|nr:hypothetical protein PHYNN_80 [Pantoea phage Phynn]
MMFVKIPDPSDWLVIIYPRPFDSVETIEKMVEVLEKADYRVEVSPIDDLEVRYIDCGVNYRASNFAEMAKSLEREKVKPLPMFGPEHTGGNNQRRPYITMGRGIRLKGRRK